MLAAGGLVLERVFMAGLDVCAETGLAVLGAVIFFVERTGLLMGFLVPVGLMAALGFALFGAGCLGSTLRGEGFAPTLGGV